MWNTGLKETQENPISLLKVVYLLALRELFKYDKTYTFHENVDTTRILITDGPPRRQKANWIPVVYVSASVFSWTEFGLGKNIFTARSAFSNEREHLQALRGGIRINCIDLQSATALNLAYRIFVFLRAYEENLCQLASTLGLGMQVVPGGSIGEESPAGSFLPHVPPDATLVPVTLAAKVFVQTKEQDLGEIFNAFNLKIEETTT